jgi:hypothetical protein
MYCVSCEVRTQFIYVMQKKVDHLCSLVVRVPDYRSRGPGFDFRHYQIFWEIEDLELDPLSLLITIEEVLGRHSSCSGLEIREYCRRNPSRWPRGTFYSQKWTQTSSTNGGRLVADSGHRVIRTRIFRHVAFETLTAVAMKCSLFWYIGHIVRGMSQRTELIILRFRERLTDDKESHFRLRCDYLAEVCFTEYANTKAVTYGNKAPTWVLYSGHRWHLFSLFRRCLRLLLQKNIFNNF